MTTKQPVSACCGAEVYIDSFGYPKFVCIKCHKECEVIEKATPTPDTSEGEWEEITKTKWYKKLIELSEEMRSGDEFTEVMFDAKKLGYFIRKEIAKARADERRMVVEKMRKKAKKRHDFLVNKFQKGLSVEEAKDVELLERFDDVIKALEGEK